MVSQEHPNVFVRVNESDQSRSPSNRRWDVKKSKNTHLNSNEPEKYDVNEFYHFLDC